MNLCSHNHEEICYESRECPCCEFIKEKDAMEKELEQAQEKIDELEEMQNHLTDTL